MPTQIQITDQWQAAVIETTDGVFKYVITNKDDVKVMIRGQYNPAATREDALKAHLANELMKYLQSR